MDSGKSSHLDNGRSKASKYIMMYLKESQWKIGQSTKARLSYPLQIYFNFQKQGSSDACGELLPVPSVSAEPQKGKDRKEDKSIMSG